MPGPTRERLHELMFGLILLVAIAVGFAALEIAYRAYKGPKVADRVDWKAMFASVGKADEMSHRPRFRPSSSFGVVRFNSFGLRGPEPAIPAQSNVVRIAFLGDSKVMSANYPEHLTLSAQTTVALNALVPHCRFDYVTIAGPDYDMPLLARIWAEVAPRVKPDLAVTMVSSTQQLLRAKLESFGQGQALSASTWLDTAIAHFDVVRAVQWHITVASSALMPARSIEHDLSAMSHAYARDLKKLIDAIGSTPVIALGYRSRLRADQPVTTQARFSRILKTALPGLTVSQAVTLSEFNVMELARQARAAGWVFADPVNDMPTDDSYFVDESHFSAEGLAYLAKRISGIIAPAVRPDCTIDLSTAFERPPTPP